MHSAGSGNMFNEGSGQFIDVDQEILTEPVEEEGKCLEGGTRTYSLSVCICIQYLLD